MKRRHFPPNPHLIPELTVEKKIKLKDMLIMRNMASKQLCSLLCDRIKHSWF